MVHFTEKWSDFKQNERSQSVEFDKNILISVQKYD